MCQPVVMLRAVRPDLVNDATRHSVASLVSVPVVIVVGSLAAVQDRGDSAPGIGFWIGGFAFTFCYGLGYAALSLRALQGVTGDELRRALVRSNRDGRRDRMLTSFVGGSSSSIAVQFSVLALVGVLTAALRTEYRSDPWISVAAVAGVVGAWVLMTAAFASECALARTRTDDLSMPDARDEISVWDFGYLAVQLSPSFASSDARLHSASVRRKAMGQAVVGICFSTVIVALLITVIATQAP